MPTHVPINNAGLKNGSTALLEQIRTIDKMRLGKYVGTVDGKTMRRIDHAIAISFGLEYLEGLKNE